MFVDSVPYFVDGWYAMPDLELDYCELGLGQIRSQDIQGRTNGWKIERKGHSGHATPQCRLPRRTMLDMVSVHCTRALNAIDLRLEGSSVPVR